MGTVNEYNGVTFFKNLSFCVCGNTNIITKPASLCIFISPVARSPLQARRLIRPNSSFCESLFTNVIIVATTAEGKRDVRAVGDDHRHCVSDVMANVCSYARLLQRAAGRFL